MIKSKTINIRISQFQFDKLMEIVVKTEKSKSAIIQELLENLYIHNTTSKNHKR